MLKAILLPQDRISCICNKQYVLKIFQCQRFHVLTKQNAEMPTGRYYIVSPKSTLLQLKSHYFFSTWHWMDIRDVKDSFPGMRNLSSYFECLHLSSLSQQPTSMESTFKTELMSSILPLFQSGMNCALEVPFFTVFVTGVQMQASTLQITLGQMNPTLFIVG